MLAAFGPRERVLPGDPTATGKSDRSLPICRTPSRRQKKIVGENSYDKFAHSRCFSRPGVGDHSILNRTTLGSARESAQREPGTEQPSLAHRRHSHSSPAVRPTMVASDSGCIRKLRERNMEKDRLNAVRIRSSLLWFSGVAGWPRDGRGRRVQLLPACLDQPGRDLRPENQQVDDGTSSGRLAINRRRPERGSGRRHLPASELLQYGKRSAGRNLVDLDDHG